MKSIGKFFTKLLFFSLDAFCFYVLWNFTSSHHLQFMECMVIAFLITSCAESGILLKEDKK